MIRWTTIKGGEVIRSPTLGFGDGFYIQVLAKHKWWWKLILDQVDRRVLRLYSWRYIIIMK